MREAVLWAVRVDRPLTDGEAGMLWAALPQARRERLARVRQPALQREPLCAWGLLYLALRKRYGWRDLPPLAYTDRGKPWFPGFPAVCFSLSHTAGAVMAGVATAPIGVDIERIRPVERRLAERLGCAAPEAFFASWVRREARLKCGSTAVLLGPEMPLRAGERYGPVETFPGYAAGAAVLGADLPGEPRLLTQDELLAGVRDLLAGDLR